MFKKYKIIKNVTIRPLNQFNEFCFKHVFCADINSPSAFIKRFVFLTFIQYLLNTYTNCSFRLKKITDGDVNKWFLSK